MPVLTSFKLLKRISSNTILYCQQSNVVFPCKSKGAILSCGFNKLQFQFRIRRGLGTKEDVLLTTFKLKCTFFKLFTEHFLHVLLENHVVVIFAAEMIIFVSGRSQNYKNYLIAHPIYWNLFRGPYILSSPP